MLGPNGAGKTTLVLALNGINAATRGSVTVGGLPVEQANLAEIRRRVGIVFQDPDDQLFMPTVREDVAFGPANLGLRGAELEARTRRGARRGRHGPLPPTARRTTSASASGAGWRWRPCWRCGPTSSCSTSRRPTSTRMARRELAEIVLGLDVTTILVTHDLPYALQLCDRAVVLDGGRIVVDGPTREVLADRDDDGGAPPRAAVRVRPSSARA